MGLHLPGLYIGWHTIHSMVSLAVIFYFSNDKVTELFDKRYLGFVV